MFKNFDRSSLSLSICLLFFVYCCCSTSTPQRNGLLDGDTGSDTPSIQKPTLRIEYDDSTITFPEDPEKAVVETVHTSTPKGTVIFRSRTTNTDTPILVKPKGDQSKSDHVKISSQKSYSSSDYVEESDKPKSAATKKIAALEKSINFERALDVVNKKCQEYAQYRFRKMIIPPLTPGSNPKEIKKYDCVLGNKAIVGGVKAEPREFPHMALIGYIHSNNKTQWNCGGSLISEQFILSAAHCNRDKVGFAKLALLGDLDIQSNIENANPKLYNIIERILHPEYEPPMLNNDIMLFKLDSVVKFNSYMRPICLATWTFSNFAERKFLITGWGLADTAEMSDGHLKKAEIIGFENEKCVNAYRTDVNLRNGFDSTKMICAGNVAKREDACKGDSGGPVQILNATCLYTQIGVMSYGSNICADLSSPEAIHTSVYSYIDWIQSIVWP